MSSISESAKSSWMDVTNESVHTSDDQDIGDIEAISRDFIVVKRGFVNVHRYYIPMSKVEGWDGHVVWLKISEGEVKRTYQRDAEPDPSVYYIQDYPYDKTTPFTAAYFPEMHIIPSKGEPQPAIRAERPTTEATRMDKCPLCDATFRTPEQLSAHVSTQH